MCRNRAKVSPLTEVTDKCAQGVASKSGICSPLFSDTAHHAPTTPEALCFEKVVRPSCWEAVPLPLGLPPLLTVVSPDVENEVCKRHLGACRGHEHCGLSGLHVPLDLEEGGILYFREEEHLAPLDTTTPAHLERGRSPSFSKGVMVCCSNNATFDLDDACTIASEDICLREGPSFYIGKQVLGDVQDDLEASLASTTATSCRVREGASFCGEDLESADNSSLFREGRSFYLGTDASVEYLESGSSFTLGGIDSPRLREGPSFLLEDGANIDLA